MNTYRHVLSERALAMLSLLCAAGAAQATTYDAVNDFSIGSNPNGVWTYGNSTDSLGDGFSPFTQTGSDSQTSYWTNNQSFSSGSAIIHNDVGSYINYGTIDQFPDELNLAGQNTIPTLIFTAPTTGVYNVSGFFQPIDIFAWTRGGSVVENNATVLFFSSDLGGFDRVTSFSMNALALTQGATLDFLSFPVQGPYYGSVGLEATIATVPEPAEVCGFAIGFLAVGRRRRPRVGRSLGSAR